MRKGLVFIVVVFVGVIAFLVFLRLAQEKFAPHGDDPSCVAKFVTPRSMNFGDTNNLAVLKKKMDAVRKYPYRDDGMRSMAFRAVAAMDRLLTTPEFQLTSFRVGTLNKERMTCLAWAFGCADVKLLLTNKFDKTTWSKRTGFQYGAQPQWPRDGESNFCETVVWKPGDPIRVEWHWNVSKFKITDAVIGSWEGNGETNALVFLDFLQKDLALEQKASRVRSFFTKTTNACLTVSCAEFPEPAADLSAIEEFLIPGRYWSQGK